MDQVQYTRKVYTTNENTEMKDTIIVKTSDVFSTNVDLNNLYDQLKEIESSNNSEYVLSLDVAKFCA